MTTMREPSRLGRLKAQYRQVVPREKVRDDILRAMDRHLAPETPWPPVPSVPYRSLRRPIIAGALAASALTATVLLFSGTRGPRSLEVVVSAVSGQAFSEGERRRALGPEAHVPEGHRLRTSASSTLETRVGAHRVAVNPESSLLLESLQPQNLVFRLERGWATWTVSPLTPGAHLRVLAGDLSIDVVGTVFTVERDDVCSRLSVQSGRVAISYKGAPGAMQAGESRRFCPPVPVPVGSEPTAREPGAAQGDVARDTDKKTQPTAVLRGPEEPHPASPRRPASLEAAAAASVATARTRPEALSEEERLYRDASRLEDQPWSRGRRLQAYLERFPDGTFAEDALLQLIRLSYAEGNAREVIRLADQFLRRHHHGRRTHEVQLLYVQSSIESNLPPGDSLPVLESLLPHLGALPASEREQATYLAILTYCRSRRTEACEKWSERYLDEFPHGRYASEVRRSRMESAGSR